MRILGISSARRTVEFVLTACCFFVISMSGSATTLAGFVTGIPGPMSFAVGKTRVILSGATTCIAQYSHFELKYPQSVDLLLRKRGRRIECGSLAPVIGSQIDVWGRFTNADTFLASTVRIHRQADSEILEGAALLEEDPLVQQSGKGFTGEAWIDGYPVQITSDSKIFTAPAGTDLRYSLHGLFDNLLINARIHGNALAPPFTVDLLHPGAWLIYHATATADGHVTANQIRVWSDKEDPEEKTFVQEFEPVITPPDYNRHIDGKVDFNGAPPISIIADAKVQEWVSELGDRLVPRCWRTAECSGGSVRELRFLVVHKFPVWLGGYTVIGNRFARLSRHNVGLYGKPKRDAIVKQLVATPSGIVLVPDNVLSKVSNKAQLAALLSYVITSVIQHQAYHLRPNYLIPASYFLASLGNTPFLSWENGQLLRLGIRQMYLAGFDIREAPFAGTVASGSPAKNPQVVTKRGFVMQPESAYAFNYISQYYKGVDYSKLKRGEAEYAQFLDELRKADHEAFEEKK